MSRTALQMRKASGDGPVEVMQRLVLDEAPGKIQATSHRTSRWGRSTMAFGGEWLCWM